jgi:phosphatidylinositol glycan class Q protein
MRLTSGFGFTDIIPEVVVPRLPSLLPTAVHILATASMGGMTLLLALTKDALGLATLHITLCDRITRAICLWQLDSLGGLWNLFRGEWQCRNPTRPGPAPGPQHPDANRTKRSWWCTGKRWNVLRQRTDSYEYDLDQLFLGTLLFTVSAFLFPTVMVYAALLALVSGLVSSCGVSVM